VISEPIKKNDVFNYGINLKKIIQQSPITILPMFFAWEFPHKIEAVFCLVIGGFYGFRSSGDKNFMGSGYGSNISVHNKQFFFALTEQKPNYRGKN
jgi:hypothetical protein